MRSGTGVEQRRIFVNVIVGSESLRLSGNVTTFHNSFLCGLIVESEGSVKERGGSEGPLYIIHEHKVDVRLPPTLVTCQEKPSIFK